MLASHRNRQQLLHIEKLALLNRKGNGSMASSLEKFAAALNGKSCSGCQDDIARQVREGLDEANKSAHNHLAEIVYGLKLLTGVSQRILSRLEEESGAKSIPYTFSVANPAQNTVYTGPPVPFDCIIKILCFSGPQNVSVSLNAPNAKVGGATLLIKTGSNGNAVVVPYRQLVPAGSTFSIACDTSQTFYMMFFTELQPIGLVGGDYLRARG